MPALSRVGLGAWAFGGVGWGPQDDQDSVATIRHAVAARGRLDRHRRRLRRRARRADRRRGARRDRRRGAPAGLHQGRRPGRSRDRRRPTATSARPRCGPSARAPWGASGSSGSTSTSCTGRSRTDEIVEAAWATLGELREEGKIRWAGVSNFDPDLLERCAAIRPLDAAQLPLSLLEDRIDGRRAALAGRARRVDARLQPAGVGAALRQLLARAARRPARGRLAPPPAALPEPAARARPRPGRARCARSPPSSGPASPSWRSPGRSTSRASPGRSSAPAPPPRSTAGSARRNLSSGPTFSSGSATLRAGARASR